LAYPNVSNSQHTKINRNHGDAVNVFWISISVMVGSRSRLWLIRVRPLSRVLAEIARALYFEVLICGPRKEYFFDLCALDLPTLPGIRNDVMREIQLK